MRISPELLLSTPVMAAMIRCSSNLRKNSCGFIGSSYQLPLAPPPPERPPPPEKPPENPPPPPPLLQPPPLLGHPPHPPPQPPPQGLRPERLRTVPLDRRRAKTTIKKQIKMKNGSTTELFLLDRLLSWTVVPVPLYSLRTASRMLCIPS